MMRNAKKVVVVGGGPAGMMAAIRASQLEQNVTLIEKNDILGKKLLLSGNGRCNLTNANNVDVFFEGYSKNGEFLRDAFKLFFNRDIIKFFESRGLKLKTEKDGRVFPETNRAASVRDILKKELLRNKVKVIYGAQMIDIIVQDKKIRSVDIMGAPFVPADSLILATGGITHGSTGSTGEGIRLAEGLGHKIVSLRPGLAALKTDKIYPSALEGLTLKEVSVTFVCGRKQITSHVGDLLFTRVGISGPIILSISGKVIDWLTGGKKVVASVDLLPSLSREEIDTQLMKDIVANSKKSISNVLKKNLPSRLVDIVMEVLEITPGVQVSQLTSKNRKKIVSFLKEMNLKIIGVSSFEKAMITRGGISLKEINPKTMASRKVNGLFFAGEMIDLDGDTGGYNLQEAFSTGYLAGESAAK
jgi:predicted Rossmann fold flavoprotein